MSKRYQIVRDKIVKPGGDIVDAFRMAIVEFTSLGERRFDLTGYPHESEVDAIMGDWTQIGQDLKTAESKVLAGVAGDVARDEQIAPRQVPSNNKESRFRRVG